MAGESNVVVGAVLMANQVVASEKEPQTLIASMISHFEMDQVDVSLPTGAFELSEGRWKGSGRMK